MRQQRERVILAEEGSECNYERLNVFPFALEEVEKEMKSEQSCEQMVLGSLEHTKAGHSPNDLKHMCYMSYRATADGLSIEQRPEAQQALKYQEPRRKRERGWNLMTGQVCVVLGRYCS